MKKILCIVLTAVVFAAAFSGCIGHDPADEASGMIQAGEAVIDYGDAESFEADLNNGKPLEGKIVRFNVKEFHPNSAIGYNLWAGDHLNFVSSRHPGVQENDTLTVKAISIENMTGSWIIRYEKIDNAVTNENTITYSSPAASSSSHSSKTGSTTVPSPTDTSKVPEKPEEPKGTYEENPYYEIVETGSYKSWSDTILIHKVLAKKDATVEGTLIAFDAADDVIGKASDEIVLTAGQYNYFRYYFENDISKAIVQTSYKVKGDSSMMGDRNAVEMVKSNKSGSELFITLKQVSDDIGSFPEFKLLFYKGDKIVYSTRGYIHVYAKDLNGKDSTDIISISTAGISFDKIEFIYEP